MNILVTGCAGFIGWKVCEFLLADGHQVVGVDNLNDAYDVRLKQWRLEQLEGRPGFEFHRLDICDRTALSDLFHSLFAIRHSPIDAVINLAARAGVRPSVENPWVYYETNVIGTINLLELCKEFSIKKFVLASTSSLYGRTSLRSEPACVGSEPSALSSKLSRPFAESDSTDHPLSPYAASKKAAEALCHTYHHLHGIDVSIPRYFTVYGPAGRPDMSLFRFVQWVSEGKPVTVYGDGRQSRDFTYVGDVARATVAALAPVGYEIINVGSDQPMVLNDALRMIEQMVGRQAQIVYQPLHAADVLATWADIGKARRLLNWRPEREFSDGLGQLVRWYQENRDWAKELHTA